jgi:hypothetical protein
VTRELVDGRTSRAGTKHSSKQLDMCLRFLWMKYQFDAEGMPDKWHFDAKAHTIATPARSVALPSRLDDDNAVEEEARAIAQASMHAILAESSTSIATFGPNVHPGPRRYIGVMKPVELFMVFRKWFSSHGLEVISGKSKEPSFTTFLRALQIATPWLKFRKKAGQRANCDICVQYKTELKKMMNPNARGLLIEEYNKHLLDQWLDREIDLNFASISAECAVALRSGQVLLNLSKRLSSCLLRVDGVDQAKFRVPRVALKSHAFEKLLRPALHIQGAWCHGFGFHFAVADADCRKDTNNNVEVRCPEMNLFTLV